MGFAELFFDLVFVFAVTQLSHTLATHYSLYGLAEVAFLLMAVWWVWIYTTWATNWLNPQSAPVRLMLFTLMLAGLVLSMSIPQAFAARGFAFACAYALMQVGRSAFMCWCLRGQDERNYRNFLRITAWLGFSGLFWIAGGFAASESRFVLWGAALAVEYVAPAAGFWTPGLGRSLSTDWAISGGHMAERCGLFMIIALGESILVTGDTFSRLPWTAMNLAAFLTAFAGTVAMWWVYFGVGAEHAAQRIARADDPGGIARRAYTYLHILLVAGLVLAAVSYKMLLAYPDGKADIKAVSALIGGPALYLLGNLLFKRAVFGKFPPSHIVGLMLLAALAPFHGFLPPLALGVFATGVLVLAAAWETSVVSRGAGDLAPPA